MGIAQNRPPELERVGWKTWATVLPFLVLFWANIWHHTLFFDEVNAWAISAASPNLTTLFHYVHFEGHPWLWYFVLWFPSRLTHDPVAIKWVEAAIGTAIIVVVGVWAPFRYWQRALILSSYFLVWEYTVMCRMYSLMVLFTLVYLLRRVRRQESVTGNCVLLGLIGNADMTGVMLSSALLLEYAVASRESGARREWIRQWAAGVGVYAAMVGFAVATLWPSKEISWQSSGRIGSAALDRHWIDASLGNVIAAPWWPISPVFPHRFWETTVREAHWLYLLIPVVLVTYWMTFRRERSLLVLMGATLAIGFVFADVVFKGNVRNWGIAFVAFVAGLWIQAAPRRRAGAAEWSWGLPAYGLLALSTAAAVLATAGSWARPFSRARDTARWLERNNLAGSPLIGMPDVSFASVAEEMQQPVYFVECGCVDTFKLFSRDREDLVEDQMAAHVRLAMQDLHTQQVTFVLYRPLEAADLERLRAAKPLASFTGAEVRTENFFVYRIRGVAG